MNEIGKIYHLHSGMETPYILRNLGKSDIEQILDLQDRALGYDFNLQWFYPFSAEELVEIFDSDGSIAIGVYIDGKLIAFRTGCSSGIEYEEITSNLGGKYKELPCFLMNGAFVDRDYRSNNLQQKLSVYCMEKIRQKGINTFLSVAHPDNISSIKSLKNIGFVEKDRKMIFGGKYDRLILVKEMN